MNKLLQESLQVASSETDGSATTQKSSTESGAEFGLRPRQPGVLYTKGFPPKNLIKRLVKDGIYCRGLVTIDGVLYNTWEKESITRPKRQNQDPILKEDRYDVDGKIIK